MREEGEGKISKGGQGVTGARENGREGGVTRMRTRRSRMRKRSRMRTRRSRTRKRRNERRWRKEGRN